MAIKGKQPIQWIRHCWLKAIGQDSDKLVNWYIHGIALGEKSMGAVNVRAPSKRWGGAGNALAHKENQGNQGNEVLARSH